MVSYHEALTCSEAASSDAAQGLSIEGGESEQPIPPRLLFGPPLPPLFFLKPWLSMSGEGQEGAQGGFFLTSFPQVIPFLPPTMSQASNVPDQPSSLGRAWWCLMEGISSMFLFLLHRLSVSWQGNP